jgi:PEP-CTERM motif
MFARIALVVLSQLLPVSAISAPITYSFSTAANSFSGVSSTPASVPFSNPFSSSATVSGTFVYDANATFNSAASSTFGAVYGSYSTTSSTVSSFNSLAGSVAGMTFSDTRGVTIVGNDRIGVGAFPGPIDFLGLWSDNPTPNSTSPDNFTGFSIGAFTLINVRFFWAETQSTPTLITDFLSDESMPATLPTFAGRLALDFVETGTNPSAQHAFVFFDGLTVVAMNPVSEPGTYSMILMGFVAAGFVARRRAVKRA